MLFKKHIFLCGFMGSGKTTHGKKLSSEFHIPFIDLDAYIEDREGSSISKIFERNGERFFRDLESKYLNELFQVSPSIISLGGGTVCFNDNLEKIKRNGILVYISMNEKALSDRLVKSYKKRPLLKNISEEELPAFIGEMLQKRIPFYNQAHLIINGVGLKKSQLVSALHEHLNDFAE